MKKMLYVAAASALCLSLCVAALAMDDAKSASLCAYTAPDGTRLELFGVTDEARGIADIVAVVKKDGMEERTPLVMYDSRYEPELVSAAPAGGSPNEALLRVFAGSGTGFYVEELYLLRPYVGGGRCGLGVFPFEGDQLARLAAELVDIRADGNKVSFVRSDKAGRDAGALLFSVDADAPIKLDDKESAFTQQVRYRFDSTGRAVVRISPVLASVEGMPMWCDEMIEFDVSVITATDGGRSFSLSNPRLADTQN